MLIDLEISDLETVENHGTVVAITGTSRESGTSVESARRVRFAGDHRTMAGLLEAVSSGEPISAQVEDWQVISMEEVL